VKALLLVLAACIHMPHVDPALRSQPDQLATSVRVEVLCMPDDAFDNAIGGAAFDIDAKAGSGTIVSARHVLTAAHVVACPTIPIVHVQTAQGKRLRMAVTKQDDAADLALLELASGDRFGPIAPPVIGTVAIGDAWCLISAFPHRAGACGFVEAFVTGHAYGAVGSAQNEDGNSGGGVFVDGMLVGVHVAGLPGTIGVVLLADHRSVMP
jgi:hypothetical protein